MIALDSETTGLDLAHGARPFFITVCDESGEQSWFEWDVDPVTRQPQVPPSDIAHLQSLLKRHASWAKWDDETRERHKIVGQNVKFDAKALAAIGVADWPWSMTHDTLIAGHLLASNRPHDLTKMTWDYCGIDIEPHEIKLKEAVTECRRMIQQAKQRVKRDNPQSDLDVELASWQIAKEGLACMPSAKGSSKKKDESLWAFDMWLPRAMAKTLALEESDPWWTVLRDYSNADSAATVALWQVMRAELHRRNLWAIYQERMKLLPVIAGMETRGVTMSRSRLCNLWKEFTAKSQQSAAVCVGVAKGYGYDLELPDGARNNSLTHFCFGKPEDCKPDLVVQNGSCLNLPILARTEAGFPAFDKDVLEEYTLTLPSRSKQLEFVKALQDKRKRGTQLAYMDSYEKFMVPLDTTINTPHAHPIPSFDPSDWYVIHPNLNPTGTVTLRLSSNNPNSQQCSKKGIDLICPRCSGSGCSHCNDDGTVALSLRYIFGPAPGREWWAMDYENIELRIPAYESGEEAMIELFERPDDPPYFGSYHLLNASIVYVDEFNERVCPDCVGLKKELKGGEPCSCVKPKVRLCEVKGGFKEKYKSTLYQWDKNGGFALQYGCQERKADATFRRKGAYKALKAKLPKVAALSQRWIQFAERNGCVETLPDKTVDPNRGYPLLCTRCEWGEILPTVPLSYHVQSTACQAGNKAAVRCNEQLDAWRRQDGFDGFITLYVHDELVFDLPCVPDRGNLPRVRRLQQLMEQSGLDIGIPLKVAVTYCPETWGEGMAA